MRPYTILNFAMTVDGKIASYTGESSISSELDKRRVHELRASVDAVVVGSNTVLVDDPRLDVRYVEGRDPLKVVVDGSLKIPLNSRLVTLYPGKLIVGCTQKADAGKVRELESRGVRLVRCGVGEHVDLPFFFEKLYELGIRRVLVEGGGELNWHLLVNGLINEVQLTVAPFIVGGKDAITPVEGKGFPYIKDGFKLRLTEVKQIGEEVILHYSVTGR
ncbi:2,5-diamino-6-(ribosylamino)-4(3H)-pyrimidinone 5'-phosphate reductase [Candidatus Marsarchaeota G2 archaeon OSP_D]|jgi:2,5-diamino-6-(ribosylamino)-4(3H)-pyrimidinone 5'-phosphate reductase|uniref:2,5-diamino-6-(ribosylamino)-4(3H)-pyrimidinone 5'-phosphate reductase n=6 Tax=Candidatus Marsarchaeota group 2 TaxID=2203771 RepID=A0A2R6CF59_9ARCH|nr:MAG: 2,5-diamino-6-(ribosylamino)-4(3H)-pyrimidinone 5'-phosphate reductase [Candidatus Marsarchaeota G2 archaeon OSP_D]PSN94928.1 MAG: 2,5-diamino-6-(ribosylamino)-4(3H)-pyrimidinone 5'-phosphate reductase [Candidatus Marsarchaeota G2 archaeon ECH_B_2]PSN95431.1 MAG: 2,5-diamino-6-(ribosylamino)-4(3H)-pyrimidinone 5'-phosphate reductase [Candidatus Marsarchaeota G2 archaeon ECH_B_SAG-C16]PSN99440.1 MAG: 2,5-diamino-6-(ribosylamino)-4(3H)-pyrimidinone 5'-phosphate reductase [Candidatus Marsar